MNPLRLYCYRISEQLVVLFNGGLKSSQDAQDSKDLSMKFHDANQYTKGIIQALNEGMILIEDERTLLDYNGNINPVI